MSKAAVDGENLLVEGALVKSSLFFNCCEDVLHFVTNLRGQKFARQESYAYACAELNLGPFRDRMH